jgi:subtilisin family serine protease
MPEFPRELPHLYLRGNGKPERYRPKGHPQYQLPQRDRAVHAEVLQTALRHALDQANIREQQRNPELLIGTPGFYLDFQIRPGSEHAAELLENRPKEIELVAFRQEAGDTPAIATVFVPDVAANHFMQKVDAYRHKNTKKGNPTNQNLIARIDTVAIAAARSVYTDDPALLPAAHQAVWWEMWLREGHAGAFDEVARRMGISVQQQRLVFPDREVRLVHADEAAVGRLFLNSNAIAEIRRAKDTPALFVDWSNVEQAAWASDLAQRLVQPNGNDIAICILDTGVTRGHPLLAPALAPTDVHTYDPTWPGGDIDGHGTKMAGTALYGDLMPLLAGNGPVPLTHRLESVKILPDGGQNEPRLYGAITVESVARAEVGAPQRRRAVCLAVTSDIGTNRGRPSSWSAAIDQLCFDEDHRRLILISAGNIREGISKEGYPSRNETETIENPGQAWNAITVGAYTEKSNIVDPTFAGWEPLAPVGELCPTSRTSLNWERPWPIKPDLVLEGGNWASFEDQSDKPDDLGILSTYRDPAIRHFDIFRDTSAATAIAGNLAGKILAAMPQRWPETVRALMVHSAEWTLPMRQQFESAVNEQQKRSLLRKYGYGVPTYDRAALSAINDLTVIDEDELQPFWKNGGIKTRDMNLHELPWPSTELQQLGETDVEFRITLSYYVEPNPGERGWLRRHRYASHALRFAMQRPLESIRDFRKRINDLATEEEENFAPIPTGGDRWFLGRVRDVGSVHSDLWRGPAVELAARSAIGIYPIGGWWKENPNHHRYERKVRYALIVSIRAVNGGIDIYTPVRAQIPVEVTT